VRRKKREAQSKKRKKEKKVPTVAAAPNHGAEIETKPIPKTLPSPHVK
jgi:hypothetical protein